jgi:hypothetical protein
MNTGECQGLSECQLLVANAASGAELLLLTLPHSGIQDAANLAWKVALAVSGGMADSHRLELLLTYQEERHPIGAAAVRASGPWGLQGLCS